MAKVYEQINPEALGRDVRDLNVAMEYCVRLNKRSKNLKADGIQRLVHGYPSHDFVIDLEEAREIFERVGAPTRALYDVILPRLADVISPRTSATVVEMLKIARQATSTGTEPEASKQVERKDGPDQTSQQRRNGGRAKPTS
jgi:hypothetical protein